MNNPHTKDTFMNSAMNTETNQTNQPTPAIKPFNFAFHADSKQLALALSVAKDFTSKDATRSNLWGVNLKCETSRGLGRLLVEASNGVSAVQVRLVGGFTDQTIEGTHCYINSGELDVLMAKVKVNADKMYTFENYDTPRIHFPEINNLFNNLEVNDSQDRFFGCNAKLFSDIFKSLAKVTKKDTTRVQIYGAMEPIRFDVKGNGLEVRALGMPMRLA
jgi:hypothetical protein